MVVRKRRGWNVGLARLWLKRAAWLDATCTGEVGASQIEQDSAQFERAEVDAARKK